MAAGGGWPGISKPQQLRQVSILKALSNGAEKKYRCLICFINGHIGKTKCVFCGKEIK